MDNYQLIFDVWEGQLEINEAELLAGGITGLVIRLNDMYGGHHKDTGFDKQWSEASSFVRWPYFVYNPWVSGEQNYGWLAANMPTNCPAVAVDVEVRKDDLPPATYGAQVAAFLKLAQTKWKVHIYTAEWFINYVTPWPKMDYWWAQYPAAMYPVNKINVSWTQLRTMISQLNWPPANANKCPGTIRLWQCSGDRLITPGNDRPMDINLFPGTVSDLRTWLGYAPVVQPPKTLEERVAALEAEARTHGWNI
jgi:hypothetical protein